MPTTVAYDFCALVAAREQLSRAIDVYESSCSILDSVNLQHSALPKFAIQTFFSSVEHERDLLTQQTSRILRINAKLEEIRNRSVIAVPIGRLSPDILSTIFTMAAACTRAALVQAQAQANEQPEIANVLSSVCSHWRQVALETPALWAHIDLNRRGGLGHVALWLDRARSYPLQVFSEYDDREGSDQEWIALLAPHGHHFHALTLDLDFVGESIFRKACASHSTAPFALEFLALFCESKDGVTFWESGLTPSEIARLHGTHSIHLENVLLDSLSSPIFQGLYHLCLSGLSGVAAPSLAEIMDVLKINPALRYLELSKMEFNAVSGPEMLPVAMGKLETLRFGHIDVQVSQWLLRHVVLRPEGVTLVVSGYFDPHEDRIGVGLQVLSNQSITTFCFLSPPDEPNFLEIDALLSDLPCLKTLALEDIFFRIYPCSFPADKQYPVLANLSLVSCFIDNRDLFMDMVVRHSVPRMRVFDAEYDFNREFVINRAPDIEFSEEPGSSVPPDWRPFD